MKLLSSVNVLWFTYTKHVLAVKYSWLLSRIFYNISNIANFQCYILNSLFFLSCSSLNTHMLKA